MALYQVFQRKDAWSEISTFMELKNKQKDIDINNKNSRLKSVTTRVVQMK